ncbi:putative inner membrane transporter yiJE OS=Afipia felis OX=1035 GN=yijE_2 PE=4 SV=1 [Afipia felis]
MDRRTPGEPIVAPPPTLPTEPPPEGRMAGYGLLLITTLIWGINWPVAKYLLHELPPLTMRTLPGVFSAMMLAGLVLAKRQSLRVPRSEWGRLFLYALLMVGAWMGLMGLSLVHLPASETAILGATIPVWAVGLAWPFLGERLSMLRIVAIAMAVGGVVLLMGGDSISVSWDKLPGILYALLAALLFALGAVLSKRRPVTVRPLTGAVWQIGLGCFPVALTGLLFEHPHFGGMSTLGWALFGFCIVFQGAIGYACWFAALERLPASTAAIGTLIVPVTGVVASAISLGEPLGLPQIGALLLTVTGVAIAARS